MLYTVDIERHEQRLSNKSAYNQKILAATKTTLPFIPFGREEPVMPPKAVLEPITRNIGFGVGSVETARPTYGIRRHNDTTNGALAAGFMVMAMPDAGPKSARDLPPLQPLPSAKRDHDIFGARAGRPINADTLPLEPMLPQKRGVSHKWNANRWAHGM